MTHTSYSKITAHQTKIDMTRKLIIKRRRSSHAEAVDEVQETERGGEKEKGGNTLGVSSLPKMQRLWRAQTGESCQELCVLSVKREGISQICSHPQRKNREAT